MEWKPNGHKEGHFEHFRLFIAIGRNIRSMSVHVVQKKNNVQKADTATHVIQYFPRSKNERFVYHAHRYILSHGSM